MEPMIEVNDVSMRYRMINDRIHNLKDYVVLRLQGKLQHTVFEALRHVTFQVQRGEVVGLIGRNGAGKSTMLKVISGILKPTEGSVIVHGNTVPMLELGSGFDYDMTGRENIYLNGAVLGYQQEYLKKQEQAIIDFAEIGQFIDVPLRNYSSGMVARLAFSIATVVKPQILIVDEVLSVGDAEFRQKSFERMKSLMQDGTTVLLVSHSISQIRQMCSKAIWLEHGEVKMFGSAGQVCDAYEGSQQKY